jgi:hypothetical protein
MEHSNYIRPSLAATRQRIPDPGLIVDLWVARAQDLLRETAGDVGSFTAIEALNLFALQGRLLRTRPEIVAACGGQELLATTQQLVLGPDGVCLAQRALAVPNPNAWLEQAQRLYDSYEEDETDPVDQSRFAEMLVGDLDDVDLLIMACHRLHVDASGIDDRMTDCHEWLSNHADCFLAASVWVQAVGQTFRPDLETFDIDLCLTAEKYVRILDAAEQAEAELSYRDVPPWHPEMMQQPVESTREELSAVVQTSVGNEPRVARDRWPRLAKARWFQTAIGVATAASLFAAGIFVDRTAFLRDTGLAAPHIVPATAVTELVGARGLDRVLEIRITSPIAGFATVVALIPNRRPQAFPVLGGDDIPVAAGTPSQGVSLPDATMCVVFVVTETPAGEPIRRMLSENKVTKYSPEQDSQLRNDLQELLIAKGYHRIAVGKVVPSRDKEH